MTYAEMISKGLITFPTTVDDATKALIYDWFQYREVNDNEQFPIMFKRKLAMAMRKYNQLLRIEPGQTFEVEQGVFRTVTYDWLVQSYREAQNLSYMTGSDSSSIIGSTSDGGSDTHSISMSGHDVTDRDGSGSTSTSGEDHESSKGLSKASPQSISYAGSSGMPNTLDWTYPGGQTEGKSDNTNSSSQTSSSSDDVDFTTSRTTTDRITYGRTGSSSESRSGEKEETNDNRSIESGRSLDIATLLGNAKDFILGSSAWDYLYAQIDKCFQCVIMEW